MDRLGVGKLCLALPGAVLDHPWGDDHDAYKVGGKMFALVGAMGGLSFKASEIAYEALTQTGRAGSISTIPPTGLTTTSANICGWPI